MWTDRAFAAEARLSARTRFTASRQTGDLSLIHIVRAPNGGSATYVLSASSPPAVSS